MWQPLPRPGLQLLQQLRHMGQGSVSGQTSPLPVLFKVAEFPHALVSGKAELGAGMGHNPSQMRILAGLLRALGKACGLTRAPAAAAVVATLRCSHSYP